MSKLQHLAIIMDGNRRAGQALYGDPLQGHVKGAETVEMAIRVCLESGIVYVTLYAISNNNLENRPDKEVRHLMNLFRRFFAERAAELIAKGIRVCFIGKRNRLDADILMMMMSLEYKTRHNDKLTLTIAIDYGGQDELVRAAKKLMWRFVTFRVNPFRFAKAFHDCLDSHFLPDVDLLLRTGGDVRLSDFLLWKVAYAEFDFVSTYWATLTEDEFRGRIANFFTRKRRFGGNDVQAAE